MLNDLLFVRQRQTDSEPGARQRLPKPQAAGVLGGLAAAAWALHDQHVVYWHLEAARASSSVTAQRQLPGSQVTLSSMQHISNLPTAQSAAAQPAGALLQQGCHAAQREHYTAPPTQQCLSALLPAPHLRRRAGRGCPAGRGRPAPCPATQPPPGSCPGGWRWLTGAGSCQCTLGTAPATPAAGRQAVSLRQAQPEAIPA